MDEEELETIARDLETGRWIPSTLEVAVGEALFHRCARLEAEAALDAMPAPGAAEPPWLTQVWAGQAALVTELREELLPVWARSLSGGRMLALVQAYAQALDPAVELARRMTEAWRERPPVLPGPAGVERWAAHQSIGVDVAQQQLVRVAVRRWEDRQLSAGELEQIDVWELRALRVGAVLSEAVWSDGRGLATRLD